jgi:hypothetical protein
MRGEAVPARIPRSTRLTNPGVRDAGFTSNRHGSTFMIGSTSPFRKNLAITDS